MNNFVKGLFLFCVFLTATDRSFSEKEKVFQVQTPQADVNHKKMDVSPESNENIKSRSIADTGENKDNFTKKQSKPLRSIFLNIYKNYKSTYLGNKTLIEYKQTLRENMKNKQQLQQQNSFENATDYDDDNDEIVTEYPSATEVASTETTAFTTVLPTVKQESKPNQKRKISENISVKPKSKVHQYNVGPALNLSLDLANSIVKVNLDGEVLKEVVTGRWLNDNTEEGRGKKYEMVTRILPLFILPFLIQSAIVPFLVTKLKLLLMKSILVGKLAIFLLIISAFRNSNKQMQTYEVAPSYWASEPSRRSELAAAASNNMAYNGYRVEGKPAAWVN